MQAHNTTYDHHVGMNLRILRAAENAGEADQIFERLQRRAVVPSGQYRGWDFVYDGHDETASKTGGESEDQSRTRLHRHQSQAETAHRQ